MKKVGYHYTSYDNWLQIRHLGLIPYSLYRLRPSYEVDGVWLWPSRLLGDAHVGAIVFHLAEKRTIKIVLLKVLYDTCDIWKPRGILRKGLDVFTLHNGFIGDWQYHFDEEGIVVTGWIPPEDIKLEKVYDLEELLV